MADDVYTNPNDPERGATRIPVEPTGRRAFPAAIKRISWGAIFAGTVVALVTQMALSLLGLAIGFGAVDPATEANPLGGIGTGAGIWLAISSIASLFAGGLVAARLAGLPRKPDGILHGIVTWGLVTLLTFYLMTSAAGQLLSGAAGIVGQGFDLLGQGVAAVAPEAGQAIRDQLPADLTLEQIENEAVELLRQSGVQPEDVEQQAGQALDEAGQRAAEADLRGALERLLQTGRDVASEADREAVVNILVARTELSRAEAEQRVQQYEERFQQARQETGQTASQVGEGARDVADSVLAAMSRAALWAFIAMVVGAAAAAAGGAVGTPHDLPASPAVRRE